MDKKKTAIDTVGVFFCIISLLFLSSCGFEPTYVASVSSGNSVEDQEFEKTLQKWKEIEQQKDYERILGNYEKIHEYMASRYVRGYLGEPDKIQQTEIGGEVHEYWYYMKGEKTVQIYFENDAVRLKSIY